MARALSSRSGILRGRTVSEQLLVLITKERMGSSWSMMYQIPSRSKTSKSTGCPRQRTMQIGISVLFCQAINRIVIGQFPNRRRRSTQQAKGMILRRYQRKHLIKQQTPSKTLAKKSLRRRQRLRLVPEYSHQLGQKITRILGLFRQTKRQMARRRNRDAADMIMMELMKIELTLFIIIRFIIIIKMLKVKQLTQWGCDQDDISLNQKLLRNRNFVDRKLKNLEEDIERRCRGFTQHLDKNKQNKRHEQNPEVGGYREQKYNKNSKLTLKSSQISLQILPSIQNKSRSNFQLQSQQPKINILKQEYQKELSKKQQLIYIYENMLSKIISVINNHTSYESLTIIEDVHNYHYQNVETVLEDTMARLSNTFDVILEYEGMRATLEKQLEQLENMVNLRESRILQIVYNPNELFKISEKDDESSRESDKMVTDMIDCEKEESNRQQRRSDNSFLKPTTKNYQQSFGIEVKQ